MRRSLPSFILFPYTTLFRSVPKTASRKSANGSLSYKERNSQAKLCRFRFTKRRKSRFFFRSEEHTSELQSLRHLVCRLLLEKKNAQAFNVHFEIFACCQLRD